MPSPRSRRRLAAALVSGVISGAALGGTVVALAPGTAGAQAALTPPPAPVTPLPAGAGTGRRVVYDMGTMHVWLVETDGTVVRDYPVSGHKYRKLPGTGVFWVYSHSRYTGVANSPTRMEYMVRFAVGNSGTAIGFHSIPTKHGKAIQAVGQLGRPFSHGCVRQSEENAAFLYSWAPDGTQVFVIDTTGRVPAAKPRNFPKGLRPMTPIERLMTLPMLLARPGVKQ
jgi:L,D-transpeptidase-like protein